MTKPLLGPGDSLLLYGQFNAGKTSQVLSVVRALHQATNKKALIYASDRGSIQALQEQGVDKGLAEMEVYKAGDDPHIFIDSAVCGKRRDAGGKWVPGDPSSFCAAVFESLSGFGDAILSTIGHQVADGTNVGGDAMKAPSLAIQADGYVVRIASNSPTHYGMAQKFLLEKVLQAQNLPMPTIWTAHEDVVIPVEQDDKGNRRVKVVVDLGVNGVIGPHIAGHGLTMSLGKYFTYLLRIKEEVKATGTSRVLFTTRHKDGLYEALAANRAPLGSNVPAKIEPADVVKLLQLVGEAKRK